MNKKHELGGWQEQLILTSQKKRQGYQSQEKDNYGNRVRVRIITAVLYIASTAILSRLVYLQILSGKEHLLLSENNHLERKVEYAARGNIYDRSGVPLTENIGEGPSARKYLLATSASHITGYLSETRDNELGCREGICYTLGEWIGRSGIEKTQEATLRGKDGGKVVEVDARGVEVRDLGKNVPEEGEKIELSIDSKMQMAMNTALNGRYGSAIAIDMNGKVLGLVSSPSFDPNLFTVSPDKEKLNNMLSDQSAQYFLDRAVSGTYAPGSVFKPVVAVAGLTSGEIKPDTLIEDTGEIRIGKYRFGNWYFDQYGKKEGNINLEKALARSNDIFFYKTGEMVGVDEIIKWAKKFGYGEKTGIELPGEATGLVPTRLWKERLTGEKWFLGNTYHLSIGQGDLTVTPLQVARATAGVVSGRLCKVSILKNAQVNCDDLGIPAGDIETIRRGMKGACSAGGTAFPFFDFAPQVMCKTGTAQHAGQNPSTSSGQESNNVKPHAWIAVAYPADNPRMVLVVMLEAAGEGSAEAGPVAKQILSTWRDEGN